jgi:hypothetical protein
MPKRLSYQEVKNFIDEKDELISKTYINNSELLDIKCRKCSEIFKQTFNIYKRGARHKNCIKPVGNKGLKINQTRGTSLSISKVLPKNCPQCKIEFKPRQNSTKFCCKLCADNYKRGPEYKEQAKINGSKGGRISAESQQRRSKNETYFADLCIEYFGYENIKTNEPIFKDDKGSGWDADIIILSKKIAILWNGPFHYKQIFKKQSLEQVQNRDKIKMKVIENNGYKNYIIKDLGKFNKNFVKEQFELFLKSL